MGRKNLRRAQKQGQRSSVDLMKTVHDMGIDAEMLARITQWIYVVTDVADSMSSQMMDMIKPAFGKISFKDEEKFKQLKKITTSLICGCDKDYINLAKADNVNPEQYTDEFADTSDYLYQVIIEAMTVKEEDRIKLLSTIKTFKK